jgi:tetratricopeptide (TPR) repeat protein
MFDWMKKARSTRAAQVPAVDQQACAEYKQRGDALLREGKWAEAAECYRHAIAANADAADALLNLGFALKELGDPAAARGALQRALALDPDSADAHYLSGELARSQDMQAEAIAHFQRAVALQPGLEPAWSGLCQALLHAGEWDSALAALDQAALLHPQVAEFHSHLADLYGQRGELEALIASLRHVTRIQPDNFDSWFKCGNALITLKRHDEALACYNQCLRLDPGNAAVHCNRGAALQSLDRFEEALQAFVRAIEIEPEFLMAIFNRGKLLGRLGRYREGLQDYAAVLPLQSADERPHTEFHASLYHLLLGDFRQGWEKHEFRWHTAQKKFKPHFVQPLWLGHEPIQNKTIYIYPEQGFGDTIQFCRYASLLAQRGARVLMAAPPELEPVLNGLEGVTRLLKNGDLLPDFDYHCPLLSLPLAFRTEIDSIPVAAHYLQCDPVRRDAWRARLGEKKQPRAGLIWSGNPTHPNDRHRSIPLKKFRMLEAGGWQYISLQKDIRTSDLAALDDWTGIARVEDGLQNFAETAALIANLDLVITVDTSVAHLAGALGAPVWLLLPFDPDWRWLLARADSPWYPSMRIFRQPRIGDWESVLAEVRRELTASKGMAAQ